MILQLLNLYALKQCGNRHPIMRSSLRIFCTCLVNCFSELHTNLASLRRGDTDPFTPPEAAFKRDSKMRRSKAAKELLKKNGPLSPIQVSLMA